MAEILLPILRPMANYSCKNLFPSPYRLATIHPAVTDGRTEEQTDDNHDNSLTFNKVRSANKRIR